jgi:hypothetical protein
MVNRLALVGLRGIGAFNLFMAFAVTVSLVSKFFWARGTVFLPYGLKVAVPCEVVLIVLSAIFGYGCLKRSAVFGRYVGSVTCVLITTYYAVVGFASFKMAAAPAVRIIFIEWMVAPALLYATMFVLLNTRLKKEFGTDKSTSA